MYEIITKDNHFQEVVPEEKNCADVMGLSEWEKYPDVSLDQTRSGISGAAGELG